jgi:phosphoadenosine phosphosulfate reductase
MSATKRQLDMFDSDEHMATLEAAAIALLRKYEPEEGYYLAFSGGKDSCVIKHLAIKAGVKFTAHYHNTTIDPPELVRFIKKHHPDALWNKPKMNMMKRVAERAGTPPTRRGWGCCEEYKETVSTPGATIIVGVRAAESKARADRWGEHINITTGPKKFRHEYVCPIVHWSDDQLWKYIKDEAMEYCELYDQGFKRLGCVCCPLASKKNRIMEGERWPRFKANWKKAIIKSWENRKDGVNRYTGKPLYQAKFKTGEDFWLWWWEEKAPTEEDCQMELMFTNANARSK